MGLGRIGGSRRGAVSDSRCWLGGGQHLMARPYSADLRERVVAAVERDGMSRHEAAAHFSVAVSTAVGWLAGALAANREFRGGADGRPQGAQDLRGAP